MSGTTNAMPRRLRDPQFAARYFVGDAIDIGAGGDSLAKQIEHWPLLDSVQSWDKEQGDAHDVAGVESWSLDLVYSSHCLEHLMCPVEALRRWWQLVRPGGHLVVVVPDEDLYEQREWPSTFNADHKWTFTTWKSRTWSPVSVSLVEQLPFCCAYGDIVKIERIEEGFDFRALRHDQTARRGAESCIEFIVRRPA